MPNLSFVLSNSAGNYWSARMNAVCNVPKYKLAPRKTMYRLTTGFFRNCPSDQISLVVEVLCFLRLMAQIVCVLGEVVLYFNGVLVPNDGQGIL